MTSRSKRPVAMIGQKRIMLKEVHTVLVNMPLLCPNTDAKYRNSCDLDLQRRQLTKSVAYLLLWRMPCVKGLLQMPKRRQTINIWSHTATYLWSGLVGRSRRSGSIFSSHTTQLRICFSWGVLDVLSSSEVPTVML